MSLEQWDGYQSERRRITRRVRDDDTLPGPRGIENFVTITGDIHSYLAGYVKENFDDRTSTGTTVRHGEPRERHKGFGPCKHQDGGAQGVQGTRLRYDLRRADREGAHHLR